MSKKPPTCSFNPKSSDPALVTDVDVLVPVTAEEAETDETEDAQDLAQGIAAAVHDLAPGIAVVIHALETGVTGSVVDEGHILILAKRRAGNIEKARNTVGSREEMSRERKVNIQRKNQGRWKKMNQDNKWQMNTSQRVTRAM